MEQNILAIIEQSEETSDKSPMTPGSAQAKDSIPGIVPRALDDTALGLLPGSIPKAITPPEQTAKTKKVIVNPQSGLLSVRATSKQHKEVQEYLDQVMNGAQRQVRIEATIVEIRLNDEFQAGVDWNAFRDVQSNRQVSRTVIHNTDATGGSTVFQDEASMFNLSLSNAAAGINTLTGTIHNVTAAVRLLHQFGDVKVLSTPKLVAMNNQVAVLKVVDNEVYFTVEKNEKSVNGEQMTTYTSKVHTVPIGLVMHVIPQISPEDDVSLIVRPTITRIVDYAQDPNPDLSKTDVVSRVPKIQVRELESMLTLHSGQVAVIGGLMTNVANQNDKDMPGFKELPVLGGLFENRTKSFSKTELVLFLRPSVLHAEGDLVRGREAEILKDPGQKP
ncbi:MAG: pilus (MSHA type) biogenesis protein MshL [Magnetococcales bacterium]|nr:pilus (MSHA type) biogenesis protein MshL [Magnetococcales bacterium]